MITIFDKHQIAYIIRPCPLINITWNGRFNEDGPLGGTYDIVLTGTLLDNGGSPVFVEQNRQAEPGATQWITSYYPDGPYSQPAIQHFDGYKSLNSILVKQNVLKDLFSRRCLRVEVASVFPGESDQIIVFYPKLISMNFAEGVWVNKCDYTINLEAQFLLDKNDKIIGSESYSTPTYKPGYNGWPDTVSPAPGQHIERISVHEFIKKAGFVEDFQESWSIEPEDGNGNTVDPYTGENVTRVYRLTRNLSAKGKSLQEYECFGGMAPESGVRAFEQARNYIYHHIRNSGIIPNDYDDYPTLALANNTVALFASGLINLSSDFYGGYNHSRSENFDITQGTYSVQDTWILSSGNSYENYTLSLAASENEPRNKVTIEGTIKGLTSIPASGSVYGGPIPATTYNTAYENAINKYRDITNSGQFGITAFTYKRAQNAAGGIRLNHIPLSVSLGTNEFTGEINYTIEYDDRPPKIIPGAISENITVTDTYPGDVFAIIPVIGRRTGPILQYIGGRTEYQRSFSLDMTVRPASGTYRDQYLRKPSIVDPSRTGIIQAINAFSPAREPGIRKYFVSAPQETWDPKEGRYTLNINWTYEVNY